MLLGACSTTPSTVSTGHASAKPQAVALKDAITALPDKIYFHQQDPRWASHSLGGSGEPLSSDGCLVTAAAMALSNLGFKTDPGDLVTRLKAHNGFNARGWLIWNGLEKVTGGIAGVRFYSESNEGHVRSCLADGFYPLVKFTLPSRSPHWAVVVAEKDRGFYIRDPMLTSAIPIPLSSRASKIEAVRCVGVDKV